MIASDGPKPGARRKRAPLPKPDAAPSAERSRVMRRVPSRDSTPEMRVRSALREIGKRGYRLHRKDLPGSPDIAFIGRRLAIFVHGCFWHGHDCRRGARPPKTNADYWRAKIDRNMRRDRENRDALTELGYRTVTIWECETRPRDALAALLTARLSNEEQETPVSSDPLAHLDDLDPGSRDLAPRANPEAMEFLLTRRSVPAKMLAAPGPDEATLNRMLTAAMRVPDHKKLTPWRFIVIGEETRARIIEALRIRGEALGHDDAKISKAQATMAEGPCVVACVYSPIEEEAAPEIEQILSAGAATAALVNAALASGFGANWLTGWPAHDAELPRSALNLSPQERLAGFVHIGTARQTPPERPRPALDDRVTVTP